MKSVKKKNRVPNLKSNYLAVVLLLSVIFIAFLASGILSDGARNYYKLDETSGNPIDFLGRGTAATTGASVIQGVNGIIGTAYHLNRESTISGINITDGFNNDGLAYESWTLNVWGFTNTTGGTTGRIFGRIQSISGDDLGEEIFGSGGGAWQYNHHNNSGIVTTLVVGDQTPDEFQMFTITGNSTTLRFFVNASSVFGEAINTSSGQFNFTNLTNLVFGATNKNGGLESALNGTIDEIGFWDRELSRSEIDELYNAGAARRLGTVVFLNSPANATTIATLDFNITVIPEAQDNGVGVNITNVTLFIWNATNDLVNNTEFSILTGNVSNTTIIGLNSLDLGTYIWNGFACTINQTDHPCNFGGNQTFTNGIEIISSLFNATTTETAFESFTQNITIPNGVTIASVSFRYNGSTTAISPTNTGGNNFTLVRSFDIPLVNGTIPFSWNVTIDSTTEEIGINNQNVNLANLSICGASPQNVPYVNFTFTNETTAQEEVTASIPLSTFTYFLGKGSENRTLSFSNTSLIPSFAFCFSPPDQSIISDIDLKYTNPASQQRSFISRLGKFTNITTNQNLFLLPSQSGLFSRFQALTSTGVPVSNVQATITRDLAGSQITVSSAFTDDSGFVSFFLNPDITYTATFSKSPFPSNVFTFVPSTDLRTVIISSADVLTNGTSITQGTTYVITPASGALNNNTDVLFGFNVTSSQTITLISMSITNSTGSQVGFSSNSDQGFISLNINTGTNRTFIGRYIIQTGEESFSVTKIYTIGATFTGDYSIFNQFSLFTDYGFTDFWRILLALSIMLAVMIFLSTQELVDTSESKIAVAVLLIWAFSLVGWFDTGLAVNGANEGLNQLTKFSSQFGIAILSTGAGFFFVFRRIFI